MVSILECCENIAGMGAFRVLVPDEETPTSTKELSPPEKLARITSPVEPTALQPGGRPVPRPRQAQVQVNLFSPSGSAKQLSPLEQFLE